MRFSAVEKSKDEQKDTQTVDRYELAKESSHIASTEVGFEAGFNMSASYGPTVTVGVNTGVSLNSSVQNANSEATSFGQEVTQKALSRVIEKKQRNAQVKLLLNLKNLIYIAWIIPMEMTM